MKRRSVVIYMNLGPYHMARLRALAEVVPDVHVVEVAAEQELYPWRPNRNELGFPLTTLFAKRACEAVPVREQRDAITLALSRIDPVTVIVAGYREPAMQTAARWAWKRRRPTILLSPTTYLDHPRIWYKEWLKRKLLQRYSLVAATGERAAEYVQRLGFPKDCVFRVGNVIDNDHFSQTAVSSSCVSAEQTPSQISATHFLTVSRLSPEKNLGRLLRAYGQYRREGGGWGLVLVGSGPQEGQLRALAEDLGIPGVHFPGWKDYDEVPCYYARASCFILPSMSETWGLVVNEAMTCGLPVLVSRNCGCVPELCHDGENGYVFDPNSTAELTERMLRISASNGRLVAFGEASRRIIASFTPQTWAAGLSACINKVLQEGGSWTRQQ